MSHFLDLDDYKLQTEFDNIHGIVLHRSYRADWANGRRRVIVEEKWAPAKDVLGVGSFGTVRLETRQNDNGGGRGHYPQTRAVKQLRKLDMARMKVDVRKELLALTKFSRSKFFETQAFVNFLGWFEDDDNVYIAMEYFPHGTLDEFIAGGLTENDARVISLQLLEGLKIMHDEHFTHRDLKPQNIFVVQHSPNWWVKIGDFGISKRVATNDTALQTNVGTPLYLAPEVFHYVPLSDEESDAYTNAVDVWSFACVVYSMLALRPPFPDWPRALIMYCNGGAFPDGPMKGHVSSQAIDFVKSVLVPQPSIRPTAKTALKFPWVQDVDMHSPTSPSAPISPTKTAAADRARAAARASTVLSKSKKALDSTNPAPTVSSGMTMRQGMLDVSSTLREPLDAVMGTHKDQTYTNSQRYSRSVSPGASATQLQLPIRSVTPQDISQASTLYSQRSKDLSQTIQNVSTNLSQTARHLDKEIEGVRRRRYSGPEPVDSVMQSQISIAIDNPQPQLSGLCHSCRRPIKSEFYNCGTCKFNLCTTCKDSGEHCRFEDHWIVRRNSDGQLMDRTTETGATWYRWVAETSLPKVKPFTRPDYTSLPPRGPRRKGRGVVYDFCFQCRTTFPADEPPHRHDWEQHGSVDLPIPAVDSYSKSTEPLDVDRELWMQRPTDEDAAAHAKKMKTMESEMHIVFQQKVHEKESKLKTSEEELYQAHREIKDGQNRKIAEFEARKKELGLRAPSGGSGTSTPTGKRFANLFSR